MATGLELIELVKETAEKRYDEGWDVFIEAYDDTALWELVSRKRTPEAALRACQEIVDARGEIISTADKLDDAADLREMPTVVPGRTKTARKAAAAKRSA